MSIVLGVLAWKCCKVSRKQVASAAGCDGIASAHDGAIGPDQWCGTSADWLGVTFAAERNLGP